MQVAERGATVTDRYVAGHSCHFVVGFEINAADRAEAVKAIVFVEIVIGLRQK